MPRAYATIPGPAGDWQIHYRWLGAGPPLIMLHPSPLSGVFLEPQLNQLAHKARCIAWDTPGYGHSDPLPDAWDSPTLEPYVDALQGFLDALDIEQATLYGSATGAQIAIEFARTRQNRCHGLILENAALFSAEEVATLTEGYFPDISAQDRGEHLQILWDMAQRSTKFFPWNADDPSAQRRSEFPPPAAINAMVLAYLQAGDDYARAYRAAFANERLEKLASVTVPTRIVLWDDGLLGAYGERIANASLPENITVLRASTGMPARMATVEAAVDELLHAATGAPA